MGFAHRTLLGELLCAHIACCRDIGLTITTMAKFLAQPSEIHCKCLKGIATHLERTCKWEIRCKPNPSAGLPSIDLVDGDFNNPPILSPDEPPQILTLPNDPTIVCFVDTVCADFKPKCKSMTGHATFIAGGAVVCGSKMQTQTALSSTEAEFHAAASAAKKCNACGSHSHTLALFSDKTNNHS